MTRASAAVELSRVSDARRLKAQQTERVRREPARHQPHGAVKIRRGSYPAMCRLSKPQDPAATLTAANMGERPAPGERQG